jgi:hypothetical protein
MDGVCSLDPIRAASSLKMKFFEVPRITLWTISGLPLAVQPGLDLDDDDRRWPQYNHRVKGRAG